MTKPIDLQTVAGAHVRVHELDRLGSPGVSRVGLAIDCRDFDRGTLWISLTEGEARMLADALTDASASPG